MTTDTSSVSQFAEVLNSYSNFLNPVLIEDAIEEFGDEQTKVLMNTYNIKLQEFQTTTTLEQFVHAGWKGVTPKGYDEIELEMQSNWQEKTLEDITPPKRSWLLKKVISGSLKVFFSVPDLNDLQTEDVLEFFLRHTTRVLVDGQCVVNFEQLESDTQLNNAPENLAVAYNEKECDSESDANNDSDTSEDVDSELSDNVFYSNGSEEDVSLTISSVESNEEQVVESESVSETAQLQEMSSLPDYTFSSLTGESVSETAQLQETSSLPDYTFSSLTGENITLSEDSLEAHRRDLDSESGAGVYIATPLSGTFDFEIKILESDNSRHGSLKIGVGQIPKGTHAHLDLPYKVNQATGSGICTWDHHSISNKLSGKHARTRYSFGGMHDLHDLREGDRLGMKLTHDGTLSFIVNGQNQGVAAHGVYQENYDVYPIISVGGSTIAVRITRAEMSGPSEDHEDFKDQVETTNIPQFGFHALTKDRLALLEDSLYARKLAPYPIANDAVACGTKPLKRTATFEVEIAEYQDNPSALMKIGVKMLPAGTNLSEYDEPTDDPYGNYYMWDGHSVFDTLYGSHPVRTKEYGSVELKQGDRVGLRLTSDGDLSFFFNGKNCGIAARNVYKEEYDIYPLVRMDVDSYALRITRAETGKGSEEVPDLQELCIEKIASFLNSSSTNVNLLPLPQKLSNLIEHCIDYL